MLVSARPVVVWCAAVVVAAGCSHAVGGRAPRAAPAIDDESQSPVDVETLMLDQSQMRAITGAGDHLTIIPSMDGKVPVDIDQLAKTAPPQCQWIFEETHTFGPDVEEFHKTTFQNPPRGGLISEGAAAYRDAATARRAFDALLPSSTAAARRRWDRCSSVTGARHRTRCRCDPATAAVVTIT